jgi:hypothetical protein
MVYIMERGLCAWHSLLMVKYEEMASVVTRDTWILAKVAVSVKIDSLADLAFTF